MRTRSSYLFASLFLLIPALTSAQEGAMTIKNPPEHIADNSFMLEEAYNQEAGVVQHVNTFEYNLDSKDWGYEFGQEWPLGSQEHQLSYAVPVNRVNGGATLVSGLGDISIDYRYQPTSTLDSDIAVAPRLTVFLPTGDAAKGLGTGGIGVEIGLPLSIQVSESVVAHTNLAATHFPQTKVEEIEGKITVLTLAQSLIWLAHERFNVLVEAMLERESVSVKDITNTDSAFIINPGVRWSHDFDSGLQIVPGLSVPITITSDDPQVGLFLYLSFEHSF